MRLYEVTQPSTEYRLFIDLDGVLSNFDKKAEELLGKPLHKASSNQMWDAIKQHIKDGNQFWGDLELMPDAKQLWDYTKQHTPEILTAAGDIKSSESEKHSWVDQHFGTDVTTHVVHKSKDKAQFADENHILIDDRSKSIEPWEQAGGIGILHTSGSNTISQLKELGL